MSRPFRKGRRALKVKWNPDRKLYEPVLLEEHVLREIVDRLWLQAKIKMWRINQPVAGKTRQNEAGIPDLMGWIPCKSPSQRLDSGDERAVPLYIEVKRPGGVRRTAQIRFIEEARAGGCAAFFAESWTDVMRELYPYGLRLAA